MKRAAMSEKKLYTFVGFGFGPIQAGLFLYEAARSGNFDRLVVAEVNPALVQDVRKNGGKVSINIAHQDRLETAEINGIEIYNPNQPEDRDILVKAIAEAHEIATAVPSVNFYASDSPGSIHHLLAQGLMEKAQRVRQQCVIYTAENNNSAAEFLQEAVEKSLMAHYSNSLALGQVQILNTVIGKMSQVVNLGESDSNHNLVPITPESDRAILVEAFNAILISKITLEKGFQRGIEVFQEKTDLLPFEEAKLFGHNAVHAALGFLGTCLGMEIVSELRHHPELIGFLHSMFLDEIGTALCQRHQGVDELFTEAGFRYYAEDLLDRMLNPFLMDAMDRLTRDIDRKLGWEDRLIGSIRVCLSQGVPPKRLAFSVAAALFVSAEQKATGLDAALARNYQNWLEQSTSAGEVKSVHEAVRSGAAAFLDWHRTGFDLAFIKGYDTAKRDGL